jgi:transcriptional regulator with XRE-family HTH domain
MSNWRKALWRYGGRAGAELSRRIEEAGTTASAVAREAGLQPTTVLRIVSGETRFPRMETLEALDRVLAAPSSPPEPKLPAPGPRAVLFDRLARLGATGGAVARSLARRGIRGRQGDSDRCPIAVYARGVLIEQGVQLWEGDLAVDDGGYVEWAEGGFDDLELKAPELLELPPGCRWFVRQFDLGTFSELLEER